MADKYFPEIEAQQKYNNLIQWHKAGFTGKGIVVWNTESDRSSHGDIVSRRVRDGAPECTVLQASLSLEQNGNEVTLCTATYQNRVYQTEDFIKQFNIKVITRSVHGGTAINTPESRFWNDLKERYNLIFFNLAGNYGSEGCSGSLPPDIAMYIGAVDLKKGNPVRANYSSIGEQIKFVNFTGIWSGTSHSTPYTAGMACLLVQKYGTWITQEHVFQYFKSHCMNLGDNGFDNSYGWGLPIMGDIKKEIKLTVGNKTMLVDGMEVVLDQAPIQTTDTYRMLVPIRAITESLGANVTWDEKTRTATFVL